MRHSTITKKLEMLAFAALCLFLTGCNASTERMPRPTLFPEIFTDNSVTALAPTSQLPADFTEDSLITGNPCAPPCWQGLEAGKSTKADVLATLENLVFVDPNTIKEFEGGYLESIEEGTLLANLISANCTVSVEGLCVHFTFVDDVLRHILVYDLINATFADVVAAYGPPDFVSSRPGVNGSGKFICSVQLHWVEFQFAVSHDVLPDDQPLEWCNKITNGERVDGQFVINTVSYSYRPWFENFPRPDSDYPWLGFEE